MANTSVLNPTSTAEHTYCKSRRLSDLVKRELSWGPETFLPCSFYCTEPYFGYTLSPLPLSKLTLFSTQCCPLRHLQYRTILSAGICVSKYTPIQVVTYSKWEWMEYANEILNLKSMSWGPLWPHGFIMQLCVVAVTSVSTLVRDLVFLHLSSLTSHFHPLEPPNGLLWQLNAAWFEELLLNSVERLRCRVSVCVQGWPDYAPCLIS